MVEWAFMPPATSMLLKTGATEAKGQCVRLDGAPFHLHHVRPARAQHGCGRAHPHSWKGSLGGRAGPPQPPWAPTGALKEMPPASPLLPAPGPKRPAWGFFAACPPANSRSPSPRSRYRRGAYACAVRVPRQAQRGPERRGRAQPLRGARATFRWGHPPRLGVPGLTRAQQAG